MDWYKSKILIGVLVPTFFMGCGIFGGVSITAGPRTRVECKENCHSNKQEMTLTIPDKTQISAESKRHFIRLIDESVQKLSSLDSSSKKRVELLEKFKGMLAQAATEDELYKLVSESSQKRSEENVLFTGYFKPLFRGSWKRSKEYSSPLYSLPKNRPTQSRRELVTSGALKSSELIYLKDPFEAYLAEIQGSVGILLENGQTVHLGFAGSNNQKYESIGSELVADGKLTKQQATIPGIRGYFDSHPGSMQEYIFRNPRMVFFRKSPGETLGSAGVELLAERSVATDNNIYPTGTLLYLNVDVPRKQGDGEWGIRKISKFVIALDRGSAIKGSKRIDLYLGEGTEVGEVAGRLNSRGALEVFSN